MDDVDRRVGEELVEVGIRARDVERLGPRRTAIRAAAEHAAHGHADPAQGFHVDRADEARADDRGADICEPS